MIRTIPNPNFPFRSLKPSGIPIAGFLFAALLLSGCEPTGDASGSRPEPADAGRDQLATAFSSVPGLFSDVRLTADILSPTAMEFAPDGRVFICQKEGLLRIFKNGAMLGTPFLSVSVDPQGERGLLGIAFDPDFANQKYVYVYYTVSGSVHNRVSRFLASPGNPDVAQPGSEQILLELPPLGATNHNGGAIHFGLDGKLYIAVGENAVSSNAQSLGTPLGKILRLNKDGSIPADNPFYATATGINRAIWTLGHRNPFTFAVQPGTGRIFENDVGQDTWEEVNDITKGSNYGWPATEGATTDPRFKTPFHFYGHDEGCAIIGAAFYNPPVPQFPSSYVGDYFFGDYCAGYIKQLDLATKAVTTLVTGIASLVDIKIGPDGALYYLGRGGTLNRVSYTGSLAPTFTVQPRDTVVSVGGSAVLSVSVNGAEPLSYQWQRNGADIAGATATTYTLRNAQVTDNGASFRCRARNPSGSVLSDSAVLTVTTDRPPVPVILTPTAGTIFSGGSVLAFSGSATDPEDGKLPASAMTWQVDLHHETHTHPALPPTSGIASGSFTVPVRGETSSDIWFRIYLTATDSKGLSTRIFRDVQPLKVSITLNTAPPGLQLKLDGSPISTPYTFTGVAGIIRSVEAVTPQSVGTTTYAFGSWTDGKGVSHEAPTPAGNATLIATYAPLAAIPSVPGRVQAEDYKGGGEGVGYHDLTPGNAGGVYRNDGVDIQATTDAGGGYNVGYTQAGEWLGYDINVATAGRYALTARLASGAAGTKSAALSIDGNPAGVFSFTDASGWQNWKDFPMGLVNLTAGRHVLRLDMATAGFNLNYLDLEGPQ